MWYLIVSIPDLCTITYFWNKHYITLKAHLEAPQVWDQRKYTVLGAQTVVIEGEELGAVPVSSVVPQGSVLGPILFLVFINDLLEKLSSQVRPLADDTAVYLTIGGLDDGTVLQNDLDKLSLWETQWYMEFNPSKCQVVWVTTARKAINTVYTLHGQILEVVTSAKYFELTSSVAHLGTPTLTVLVKMQIELWVTYGEILNKKSERNRL